MGGQTALNTALDLARDGRAREVQVEMIGAFAAVPSTWPRTADCSARQATSGTRTAARAQCHSMEGR